MYGFYAPIPYRFNLSDFLRGWKKEEGEEKKEEEGRTKRKTRRGSYSL